MIDLSLIENILVNQKTASVSKHVLKIVQNILLNIDQDKINQLKSKIVFNDETFEIDFYSKNNTCCPVHIICEDNSVNILIGVGEVIYLENAFITNEKETSRLKACIEDLFYLPIEEVITFKNNKVLSASCKINQLINEKVVPVEYNHTHGFSFLPFSKRIIKYKYINWSKKL